MVITASGTVAPVGSDTRPERLVVAWLKSEAVETSKRLLKTHERGTFERDMDPDPLNWSKCWSILLGWLFLLSWADCAQGLARRELHM